MIGEARRQGCPFEKNAAFAFSNSEGSRSFRVAKTWKSNSSEVNLYGFLMRISNWRLATEGLSEGGGVAEWFLLSSAISMKVLK